jgi:preprotein translocase subunit SecG
MDRVLLVVHLLVALALIGVILLQRSEGGALGIGGGSGNLFSSRGVGNALTRATAILAAAFFATSVALTVMGSERPGSLFESVTPSTSQPSDAPATPAVPDANSLVPKPAGPATPTPQ